MEKIKVCKWTIRNFAFVLMLCFAHVGCSSRPCREPRAPELDRTKAPVTSSVAPKADAPAAVDVTSGKVHADGAPYLIRIYKADGSRQCEKKSGIPLDIMERELAGIVVKSRDKRNDGLMHVQVCGSPSGMINVYEINAEFLKQAEQRGFKRLEN
jgi:hypothetical protein